MVDINPQKITGKWRSGAALDFHTTSSTPIGYNQYGHMQYDTVRPPIAELLYQLKYRGDQSAAKEITATAANFLAKQPTKFDLIIPVPPSTARSIQPVLVLANGIGLALGLPVIQCVTTTRATAQLKNVTDSDERARLTEGLYSTDPRATAGKIVLLFDDLFRSGTTMNAITEVLLGQGQAASVSALTITRTRSNQ